MRVLSLFDGMGCGMIALRELGIEPEVYYASEIDKYALMQTSRNFPNVIHVGDVREVGCIQTWQDRLAYWRFSVHFVQFRW